VQEQYELSDGSGLRLTVARYYTPLGRSIQKSYKKGNEEYNKDLMNRFHNGEMTFADSIKHTNETAFKTSSGKVVYGGGGITPDIFVPYDTLAIDKQITLAFIKGTFNNFVYRNYLSHQKEFKLYASPKSFEEKYIVDQATLINLKDYAAKDSINFDLGDVKEKTLLQKQIKMMTARQIWRTQGLYEVSNSEDVTVNKALEFIRNDSIVQVNK
jgi:carboxyl-terminal processing protease